MPNFKTAKDLATFLRDEIDKYAGQELPDSFANSFHELCSN